jgi:hypothetical protein
MCETTLDRHGVYHYLFISLFNVSVNISGHTGSSNRKISGKYTGNGETGSDTVSNLPVMSEKIRHSKYDYKANKICPSSLFTNLQAMAIKAVFLLSPFEIAVHHCIITRHLLYKNMLPTHLSRL